VTIRKSTLTTLALAAGVAALGMLAWRLAGHEPSDEERIASMLDEMRAAAIEKDLSAILAHVAKSYQDDAGMNRDELRAVLLGYFLGARSITVTVIRREIAIQGPSATADLRLLLGRDDRGDARRIVLRLARAGEEWQVVSSRHEPLAGP
jgi:hypothetical protein